MKTFLAVVISLVVGFLAAFIPMSLKTAELKSEIATMQGSMTELKTRVEISELERQTLNSFIGAYESAMSKNYGIAQTRAITGFDKAEILAAKGIDPYGAIAPRRDEIVSILAKATEDAQPKVRLLLFGLYKEK